MQIHQREHPLTAPDVNISEDSFWQLTHEKRGQTWAWLRENAPVSWHRPLTDWQIEAVGQNEAGFWALTRAEDITFASQNHDLFSSELGFTTLRPSPGQPSRERNFLNMDPPRHTAYRKVLSGAFTPKAVARLSAKIDERAAEIIDRVVGAGEIDFVKEVSRKLPMLTVADMVGIPEEHIEEFAAAGDDVISARVTPEITDGEPVMEFIMKRIVFINELAAEVAALRRREPADDLMTNLVQAEFEGEKLSDAQIGSMLLTLSVAGNDTTKQTTTRTVIQLARNPEQQAWLLEDFDGRIRQSIEEFVRHATPIVQFARTAATDVEMGGMRISAGDKVALFYESGNRDETVWPDPWQFDLSRPLTPHLGFGGGGVHYCLGNGVAKAQLKALFHQILTKIPNIEVGEPRQLPSDFINGVISLPVRIA
jgi:cytochrome P450